MSASGSHRWSALAVGFVLCASEARAEMITPDSIPNPPSAVASANGTPVYANNLVTTQYDGLGLHIGFAAITELNNTPVWAPVSNSSQPAIAYSSNWSLGGTFVSPTTSRPTYASSVSSLVLDTIGLTGTPNIGVDSLSGRQINVVPVLQAGPNGSQIWTLNATGISWYWVVPSASQTGAWGVSAVSFTTATAPEPSSLILAGLGALGLAARFGWRRQRLTRLDRWMA